MSRHRPSPFGAAAAVARAASGALAATSLAGCGGGMPLLYPARTLPAGEVTMAAGLSGNVPVGALAGDLNNARNDAATANAPGAPGSDPTFAKGAIVAAAVSPGLAPFVSARVGIGAHAEGGVAYTGRGARIDVRRSFDWGAYSLSIGAGGTAAFYGTQEGSELPFVDLSALHGYGAEVPLLFGWQSVDGLFMGWVGGRAGWEHDEISILTTEPRPTLPGEPIGLSATRFYGGGVAGVAAGFRHVHVALEVDAAYQTVSGAYNASQVTVNGVSLAPAAALWWTF